MAQVNSTSVTRRNGVAGLTLRAAPMAVLAVADNANAQAEQAMPEKSLYERLGGVFAIAAVVDHFSDAVVKNPRRQEVQEPASGGMARQESRKAARAQVHEGAVGLQLRRILPVHCHGVGYDATGS